MHSLRRKRGAAHYGLRRGKASQASIYLAGREHQIDSNYERVFNFSGQAVAAVRILRQFKHSRCFIRRLTKKYAEAGESPFAL